MCVCECACVHVCSQLNLDGNEIVWSPVQRPFSILFAGRLTLVWYLMFPLQRWHYSSNQLQFQALSGTLQGTPTNWTYWTCEVYGKHRMVSPIIGGTWKGYWLLATPRHVTMYKMYKPLILDLLVTSLTVAGWTLTRSNVEHGWTIIFHPSIVWLTVNIHQPSITFIFHI